MIQTVVFDTKPYDREPLQRASADLLHWFSVIAPSKPRVILTHGEDGQRAALAKMIQQKFRLSSQSPAMGEVIEL